MKLAWPCSSVPGCLGLRRFYSSTLADSRQGYSSLPEENISLPNQGNIKECVWCLNLNVCVRLLPCFSSSSLCKDRHWHVSSSCPLHAPGLEGYKHTAWNGMPSHVAEGHWHCRESGQHVNFRVVEAASLTTSTTVIWTTNAPDYDAQLMANMVNPVPSSSTTRQGSLESGATRTECQIREQGMHTSEHTLP